MNGRCTFSTGTGRNATNRSNTFAACGTLVSIYDYSEDMPSKVGYEDNEFRKLVREDGLFFIVDSDRMSVRGQIVEAIAAGKAIDLTERVMNAHLSKPIEPGVMFATLHRLLVEPAN